MSFWKSMISISLLIGGLTMLYDVWKSLHVANAAEFDSNMAAADFAFQTMIGILLIACPIAAIQHVVSKRKQRAYNMDAERAAKLEDELEKKIAEEWASTR